MKKGVLLLLFLIFPISSALQISEIMYNCPGSDEFCEWIEVYNNETEAIDLTTWRFYEGGTNHKIKALSNAELGPGDYAIIADDADYFKQEADFSGLLFDSSFSLKNTGELISLKNSDGELVDTVEYSNEWGADGDGFSLQLVDGSWCAGQPTPGEENQCVEEAEEAEEQVSQESETQESEQSFYNQSQEVQQEANEPAQQSQEVNQSKEEPKDCPIIKEEQECPPCTSKVIYQSKVQRNSSVLSLFLLLGASIMLNIMFIIYLFKK